jgi:hypothetical protein
MMLPSPLDRARDGRIFVQRPWRRRGRISERASRSGLTTLPLQSRPNASPFCIMSLLGFGAFDHGMIGRGRKG